MAFREGADRALAMMRFLPRLSLQNIEKDPFGKRIPRRGRGQHGGNRHHHQQKGANQRQGYMRLGFEPRTIPFYLRVPYESYYKNNHLRRQYPPISLHQLQLLIDTNRLDTTQPIDLITLANTKIYTFEPQLKHFGFQLTDDGIDLFKAKISLEVQWTTERVIAAVERHGGSITTAYYDPQCLFAARDPMKFFERGLPIPKRMIPPEDAIEYYTDPKMRGYLADPVKIAEERIVLAQKYGYEAPDYNKDPQKDLLLTRKDPRQLFMGLEPGWVVNLRDKCILKPLDEKLKEYYST